MRLNGKVAIVTGSAQGIGRAIALGLAKEGAKVVVADLQSEKGKSVAEEISALGSEGHSVEVDVSKEASVKRLVDESLKRFGRIDILVNNAGFYPSTWVTEMKEEEWDRVMDVDLGGHFLCSRGVVPAMRAQKGGRIIGIASGIAHYGAVGGAHYAASKAGVIGFIKALARELAADGITVNALAPAITDTGLSRRLMEEAALKERLGRNPLGHIMTPDDLVGPILFLASDAASYITGQVLNVNCGSFML